MSDNNVASGCVNVFNSFFLIVIEGILTYRFPILESEEYGKMYAILHGLCAPFNWTLSCFKEDVLVMAPLHSEAYIPFWWTSFIAGLLILVIFMVRGYSQMSFLSK